VIGVTGCAIFFLCARSPGTLRQLVEGREVHPPFGRVPPATAVGSYSKIAKWRQTFLLEQVPNQMRSPRQMPKVVGRHGAPIKKAPLERGLGALMI
jgi:hypothetical protein